MLNIAHLITHPIQYNAPLYQEIQRSQAFKLKVFFENDFSLHEHTDQGFGRSISWGRDLLEGYDHQFLKTWFPRDTNTFLFPLNTGFWSALREGSFDAVWIHGYNRLVHLMAVLQARALGIPVALRGDTNHFIAKRDWGHEAVRSGFLRGLHAASQGFLAVGKANRAHYLAHGASPDRVFFAPFSVDHAHLEAVIRTQAEVTRHLRQQLELEPGRAVLLFAGRFVPEKGLKDLLLAYRQLLRATPSHLHPHLVLVGDGPLRSLIESDSAEDPLPLVRFTGFKDQMDLPHYYAIADVLVLPSRIEAWGLVVNEAMALGRPVIASDAVGASHDLVLPGRTGWTFPAGDVEALAVQLETAVRDPERLAQMGRASQELVQAYSPSATVRGLTSAFQSMAGRH
jgi:glycosyltransferase involved in cell wall biosynthesis